MEKCRIGITTQIWILTGIDWHHTLFLKKQKSLETSCFQGFLVARAGLDDLQEKPLTRHLCKNASVLAPSFAIYPRNRETKTATFRWLFSFLLAGVGFEPHDLRVMSPTSYQAALSRDIKFNKGCRTPGSNRYDTRVSRDFKSRASANSATPALDSPWGLSLLPNYYTTLRTVCQ